MDREAMDALRWQLDQLSTTGRLYTQEHVDIINAMTAMVRAAGIQEAVENIRTRSGRMSQNKANENRRCCHNV